MNGKAASHAKPAARKKINLALQGGGAHGAFTWGVVDALLADGRLEIAGISGTSAGAMNAVVLADGLRKGGPERARTELAAFWKSVAVDGNVSDQNRGVFDSFFGFWDPFKITPNLADVTSSYFSPYDLNPLDINPLREAVAREIDFKGLRDSAADGPALFISATNVQSGKIKVFKRHELTIDMLMASACLPTMFKAVEVDGIPYWDGGYMGNPALFPFFDDTHCQDIVLVQINPIERKDTPRSARDIMNRMNEITFNAPLLQEFRAIDFVARLIDEGRLDGTHYKKIRMHLVEADEALKKYGADSKSEANFGFFLELFGLGNKAGQLFLAETFDKIGVEGTLALKEQLV